MNIIRSKHSLVSNVMTVDVFLTSLLSSVGLILQEVFHVAFVASVNAPKNLISPHSFAREAVICPLMGKNYPPRTDYVKYRKSDNYHRCVDSVHQGRYTFFVVNETKTVL